MGSSLDLSNAFRAVAPDTEIADEFETLVARQDALYVQHGTGLALGTMDYATRRARAEIKTLEARIDAMMCEVAR